jgi:hypothetical protein
LRSPKEIRERVAVIEGAKLLPKKALFAQQHTPAEEGGLERMPRAHGYNLPLTIITQIPQNLFPLGLTFDTMHITQVYQLQPFGGK